MTTDPITPDPATGSREARITEAINAAWEMLRATPDRAATIRAALLETNPETGETRRWGDDIDVLVARIVAALDERDV